jgi:hypothetical protein
MYCVEQTFVAHKILANGIHACALVGVEERNLHVVLFTDSLVFSSD